MIRTTNGFTQCDSKKKKNDNNDGTTERTGTIGISSNNKQSELWRKENSRALVVSVQRRIKDQDNNVNDDDDDDEDDDGNNFIRTTRTPTPRNRGHRRRSSHTNSHNKTTKNEIIEELVCTNNDTFTNCPCCCYTSTTDGTFQQKSFLPLSLLQNIDTNDSSFVESIIPVTNLTSGIDINQQTTTVHGHKNDTWVASQLNQQDMNFYDVTTSTNTTKTPLKQRYNQSHCEKNSDSSPEAEWDGSLVDSNDTDEDAHESERTARAPTNHRSSSFIVSSSDDESDDVATENENDDDDEVEWSDSGNSSGVDIGDDDDSESGVEEDLIRRTKEIIILSSDDDDDDLRGATEPRNSTTLTTALTPPKRRPKSLSSSKPPPPKVAESKVAFRKRRMELSHQLLMDFNRTAFGSQLLVDNVASDNVVVDARRVTLKWSNTLRTTAGLTRLSRVRQSGSNNKETHENVMFRIAAIELSSKVVDSESRLRATLLHEMCHAAAWVMDDVAKPAHGVVFQRWAKRAMTAIPTVTVTTTHSYEIDFKYQWVCINYPHRCNNGIIQRHSRSIDIERQICGRCQGRLRELAKGETIHSGTTTTTTTSIDLPGAVGVTTTKTKKERVTSAYNEFVRQHAPLVRQRMFAIAATTNVPKVLQRDVIKECARLWNEQQQQQGIR